MKRLSKIALAVLALVALAAGAWAADVVITPVTSGTADVAGVTAAANLRLCAWSITEDAGTPGAARVRLRHGDDATDPELFDVQLALSQSARESFFPTCIPVPAGVFVDRVSGTTRLTLYTRQFP